MKKKLENSRLVKYAPPGINLRTEFIIYISGLTVAVLWSLTFIIRYVEERFYLFDPRTGEICEGAVMRTFESLGENLYEPFLVVLLFTVLMIAYHFIYHYQGSHMMYLMRRLPNRFEAVWRCITLPIAAFVITLLVRYVVELIYYGIYLIFTPAQCLPL